MSNNNTELFRFVRFCVVGIMNTLVTFLVFTLLRLLHVNIYASNVLGYVAGVTNSFILSKIWVYRSRSSKWLREAIIFILFFGICYAVQLLVFKAALGFFPQWIENTGIFSPLEGHISSDILNMAKEEWLPQICGMAVYSVSNFLLNRFFNFNTK